MGQVPFDFDHSSYRFQDGSWQLAKEKTAKNAFGEGFSSENQTQETIALVKQHLANLKQNKLPDGQNVQAADITSKATVVVVDYTFLSALKEHVLHRIDDQTDAKLAALTKSGGYFIGLRQELAKLGASWTQYWARKKFDDAIEKLQAAAFTEIKKMSATQLKAAFEKLQPNARESFLAMSLLAAEELGATSQSDLLTKNVLEIARKSFTTSLSPQLKIYLSRYAGSSSKATEKSNQLWQKLQTLSFSAFEEDDLLPTGVIKKMSSENVEEEANTLKHHNKELVPKFFAKVLTVAYGLGFSTPQGKELVKGVFASYEGYLSPDPLTQENIDELKQRILQHVPQYLEKDTYSSFIKELNALIDRPPEPT